MDAIRAAGALLAVLMACLPFEPRRPTLALLGIEITLLEGAAAMVALVTAIAVRGRLAGVWRSRPWPLGALATFAAVNVVSALLTPHHPALALRFSLRMVAMAAFALVAAALPEEVRRRGLAALATAAAAVAALAIAEGLGVRALDPLLAAFREAPVNVDGVRRATAGSEHPNLAAAFVMYGLLAAVGLWARQRPRAVLALSTLAAVALSFTYSRGAAAATIAALLLLALRDRERTWIPAGAGLTVAGVLGAVAIAGGGWRPGTAYDARYQPADARLQLAPGERRVAAVRVTNTGREAWTLGAFALSYHWLREGAPATEDGPRPPLPQAVAPGAATTAQVHVIAPHEPGAYRLVWDLVRADGTWFSGQGVAPAVVDVVVGDAALAPSRPAGALVWRPGRAELWSLAVQLWKERPLLGVGPDNYRRLYGPAAGRAVWDDRVYSNQTLLEAAATTGVFGASALAAALALTLWRTARSGKPVSAALFALTAGIVAHGLVDYVLAMTGHYLVLGWVVGSASAPDSDVATR